MITYLAIDPGAAGGMAMLNKEGTIEVANLPQLSYGALADIIMDQYTVVIEDVPKFAGKMIPQSATATLHFNYGYLCGHFEARGYRVIKVRPQEWQKTIGLGTREKGMSSSQWKRKLRDEAARRFPHLSVTLKNADALLLLDHARQHNL